MSPRPASPLTLEYVLLALVDQKPMHGYELYHDICQMQGISRIWNIKQALLYAILEKLEAGKYISAHLVQRETYPPRKYFHLTELGRESLQNWLKTPVRRAKDLRQEFLAKLIIAHRRSDAAVADLIGVQTGACESWLRDLQENVPPNDAEHLDEWIVYSYRLNQVESIMKWLKQLAAAMEIPIQAEDIGE